MVSWVADALGKRQALLLPRMSLLLTNQGEGRIEITSKKLRKTAAAILSRACEYPKSQKHYLLKNARHCSPSQQMMDYSERRCDALILGYHTRSRIVDVANSPYDGSSDG